MKQVNHSYRTLRRTIGALGIALPMLLIIGNLGAVERSLSFYYYTKMSTVFTGILVVYGMILITYKGPTLPSEKISENLLSWIGGVLVIIVALVPTKYGGEIHALHYVHNDPIRGMVHDVSAVLFIATMGVIVLVKFAQAKYFQTLYRILGILVFVGLAFTIYAYLYRRVNGRELFYGAVFWGETLSLWAFGVAWLRRGIPKSIGKL